MGASSNRWSSGGPGNDIAKNAPGIPQEEVSLTNGMYVVSNLDMSEVSKNWHHIIKITAEVFSPYENGVNNGKFYSLVQPPRNIPPIITQLMSILNSDVADCQELSVVGK